MRNKLSFISLFGFFMLMVFISDTAYAFGDGFLSKGKGFTQVGRNEIGGPWSGYNAWKVEITFDEVIDIVSFKARTVSSVGSCNSNPYVRFLNEKGSVLESFYCPQAVSERKIINLENVKKIIIGKDDKNVLKGISEFEIYTKEEVVYLPINSLVGTATHDSVSLSWINPESIEFKAVEVYENGIYRRTVLNPKNTTVINGLKSETEYTFKAIAIYQDGGKSIERSIIITTLPKIESIEDVKNVNVTSTYERVNLSWRLPIFDAFQHVNIYRDTINKKMFTSSNKIFETNGTYFNDLTVKPETEYKYILTTQSNDGRESDGVIVSAITPKEPAPEIVGGGYEKDENGDFLYTWTSPTTGKVKILIDGKEYKTVDAATKQILIPKEDMKRDIFGNPKVTLVPISESGKEGTPAKPKPGGESGSGGGTGSLKIPFDVKDLLATGVSLLKILGPFVLLGLSFLLFKPLMNVIKKAVSNHRERKMH